MSKEPLTITIDPDSELGRALEETDGEPVVLLRGATRFRVTRDPDDPWANYDPESVLEGLREIAGTLSPTEGEQMKELIYRRPSRGTTAAPDGHCSDRGSPARRCVSEIVNAGCTTRVCLMIGRMRSYAGT